MPSFIHYFKFKSKNMSQSRCPHSSIISTLNPRICPPLGALLCHLASSPSLVREWSVFFCPLVLVPRQTKHLIDFFAFVQNICTNFKYLGDILCDQFCFVHPSLFSVHLFILLKIFSLLVPSTYLFDLDYHHCQVFTFESSGPQNFLLSRNLNPLSCQKTFQVLLLLEDITWGT